MDYSLDTKRLSLELVNNDNVEEYFNLINVPEILSTMGALSFPLDKDVMAPVFMMNDNKKDLHWAIFEKQTHDMIGGCSLLDFSDSRQNVEIGYWLVSGKQGSGFAYEASTRLVDFTFEVLKLHKIWGETISSNEASKRLMLKMGFQEVGVLREEVFKAGVWVDRVRLELLEKDWKK